MYIQLIREQSNHSSTEGKLFINGAFQCYTLEDKDRYLESGGTKVYGKTCIPRGTYEMKLTHSNRFNRVLPQLMNVEGFTGIRIHSGNSSVDTEGCILVGTKNIDDRDDWIGSSRDALASLMEKLEAEQEHITIEIV